MATELTLPRLGQGMESGTIVRWLKSEGDAVEKGEALYELDTEKVTQEVEADASGVLLKIVAREGEEVDVGKPVAVIGERGEEIGESADGDRAAGRAEEDRETPGRVEPDEGGAEIGAEKPAEAPAREAERQRGREASVERGPAPGDGRAPDSAEGRVKASPLARRIARERGVELSQLAGTGPEGRIVAEDVERAAAAAPATPAAPPPEEVEVEQLSSLRRTIARRLTEAWEAPAFQITMSADTTRANELREQLVALMLSGAKPTLTDVLVRVTAAALMRHRGVNAHFVGDSVRLFPTVNCGIAVAIPKGLVVPVLRSVERKTVGELASEREELVARARDGKLRQEDLEGGTFTISNLGMYGVEQFTAVLNPPEVAILAVGAIEQRPVVADGELVIKPLLQMTLTCDHRAVDGATAAEFLRTLKRVLEEPGLLL